MSRCAGCNSSDADPDIGLCFECFCQGQEHPKPTISEECAGYGHPEYQNSGRCYCGEVQFPRELTI